MKTAPVLAGSKTDETPAGYTHSDRPATSDAGGSVSGKGRIPAGRSAAPGQIVFSSAPATAGSHSAADPHPIPGGADSDGLERKDPLRTNQTDTARQSQGPGPNTSALDTGGMQQAPVLPTSKHQNGGGKTISRMMENFQSAGDRTVDVKEGPLAETKADSSKGATPSGNAADVARNATEPMLSEFLEKTPERIATDLASRQGSVAAGDNRMPVAAAELQAAADETISSGKTNPGEIIDQIVKKAVIRFKDGISEARINLKPELLGHLRLSISTDNQQVTLRILAENPLVKEIIESSAAQLKADLSNQGLQMEQLEVGVNGDRDRLGHQSGNSGQAAGQRTEKTGDAAADTDHSAENASPTAPASDSGKEIDTFV
jgi:flagellar hook-length control protein FliK